MRKTVFLLVSFELFVIALFSSCASMSDCEYAVNGVKFKMIAVKGGSFMMGATPGQGNDARENEKPAHKVNIDDFWIGETEVTQELWFAVMGSNPSHFKYIDGNYPVENVSWNDAQDFIKKLNEITGQQFRLPYETEWEYAARGGEKSTDKRYAGSDDCNEVAWYENNSEGRTHAVATKKANELGIYDMCGNVWEWCEGHSADNTKLSSHIRGAAYHNASHIERISLRYAYPVETRDYSVGLRLFLMYN